MNKPQNDLSLLLVGAAPRVAVALVIIALLWVGLLWATGLPLAFIGLG